jgi:MFS family permease
LILGLGVAVWSLFTGASGLAWNYGSLFLARLGVGVGEASCSPAGNSLLGDLFPASKRARAMSIFMLGLPVGIMLSFYLSGVIAKAYGWRAVFYLALIPGLVLAALAFRRKSTARPCAKSSRFGGRTCACWACRRCGGFRCRARCTTSTLTR